MKRLVPYIAILFVTFGVITYIGTTNPMLIEELLLKIDTFGITDVGRAEQNRVARIRTLSIPYEKKEVLVNRTVFMGATTEMVYLALGEPRSTSRTRDPDRGSEEIETWIYYFANDKRPTMLEFEKGVLISAYKGSVLDMVRASKN